MEEWGKSMSISGQVGSMCSFPSDLDCGCFAIICHGDVPTVMDCHLELWLFVRVLCHSNRNKTRPLRCHSASA